MSYEADQMSSLRQALRDTEGLKYAIKEFNTNAQVFERLAEALEAHTSELKRQNDLKEYELSKYENQRTDGPKLSYKPTKKWNE